MSNIGQLIKLKTFLVQKIINFSDDLAGFYQFRFLKFVLCGVEVGLI